MAQTKKNPLNAENLLLFFNASPSLRRRTLRRGSDGWILVSANASSVNLYGNSAPPDRGSPGIITTNLANPADVPAFAPESSPRDQTQLADAPTRRPAQMPLLGPARSTRRAPP